MVDGLRRLVDEHHPQEGEVVCQLTGVVGVENVALAPGEGCHTRDEGGKGEGELGRGVVDPLEPQRGVVCPDAVEVQEELELGEELVLARSHLKDKRCFSFELERKRKKKRNKIFFLLGFG